MNDYAVSCLTLLYLSLNRYSRIYPYTYEKYSVSHGENRVYNHRLYELKIHHFPEQTRQTDFVLNGRHYYWMTLEEMEHDENIEKKNMEVVDFVKESIP